MFSKRFSKNEKQPPLLLQALIGAITLIAVAVVIFLGSRTSHKAKIMAAEQFNQQQLILARCAAVGIESCFRELSETLSSLAKLPSVQRMTPECLQCMQHTYWGFPPRTSLRLLDNNGILPSFIPLRVGGER